MGDSMYLYIPPKTVSFLCFLQVFFIAFGYLTACFCVQQCADGAGHLDAFVIAVRTYGPCVLAIPAVWGTLTLSSIRAPHESLSVTKCMFGIGLIVTFILFVGFVATILDSVLTLFAR
jgi:hypothetical protein